MNDELPWVPDHELFRVIGRGAFGEVWLGRNVMGIWRAVKVIRSSDFSGYQAYEREFEAIRRYEPVARSTEGLVQILHVGRNDSAGYFYYVMELADDAERQATVPVEAAFGARVSFADLVRQPQWCEAGAGRQAQARRNSEVWTAPGGGALKLENPRAYSPRTLRSELARRGHLEIHEVLRIALDLTRGLVDLHHAGLVHRDIKPSNVIFVQGKARLADMGLVDHQGRLSYIGTEGYVAPEGTGTPSADLYSLGLVLYEMATGFDRREFPRLPEEWLCRRHPNIWELHEVILRACEGRPEQRYRSAAELKADLAVISSGQSVRERRALASRSRRLKCLGALTTLGLVITTVWAMLSRQRAAMENEARLEAETQRVQTELALVESHLAQAAAIRQTGLTGQRYQALARIAEAMANLGKITGRPAVALSPERVAELTLTARNEAVAALTRVDLRELGRFPARHQRVWGLPVDPAVRRLARIGPSNRVTVVTVPEDAELITLPAGPADIEHVGPFTPGGDFLMVRYGNGENVVWNLATSAIAARQPPAEKEMRAAFWRGGLLVPGVDQSIHWQSLTEPHIRATQRIGETLICLTPTDDERHLVAFTRGYAEVCRLSGEPLAIRERRRLTGALDFGEFALSRDGRVIAMTTAIGQVPLLDLVDPGGNVSGLSGHAAEVVAAGFHPDGRHLASSSWDGTTRIWDWITGESRLLHDVWTSALRFSVDGRRCAWSVGDARRQEIAVWEVALPRVISHWQPSLARGSGLQRKVPNRASFSEDGRWLAVGTAYGVRLLSVPELQECAVLGSNEIYSVRFAPARGELTAVGAEGQFTWRLDLDALHGPAGAGLALDASRVSLLRREAGRRQHFTLDAAGNPVAILRDLRVHHGGQAGHWRTLDLPDDHLWLATSRDTTWMAVSTFERLHQFRRAGPTPIWSIPLRGIARFDFSPDGRQLAVLDADALRCVEASSGTVLWTQSRADEYLRVGDLAWAPDGRALAAALRRRDLSLMAAADGRMIVRLTNPSQAAVIAAVFSPDGDYLVATLADQAVQLWDLRSLRRELANLGLDWGETR
jgi:WD40 repeat protein